MVSSQLCKYTYITHMQTLYLESSNGLSTTHLMGLTRCMNTASSQADVLHELLNLSDQCSHQQKPGHSFDTT